MIRKQKKGASPAACFHEAQQMVENLGIEIEVPNKFTRSTFCFKSLNIFPVGGLVV